MSFEPGFSKAQGNLMDVFGSELSIGGQIFNHRDAQIGDRKDNKIKMLLYNDGIFKG